MQHTLSFLPSLESPTHCRYAVQTVRLSRRKSWRSVAACSELMAGQTCNLTLVFKDPFESYLARVKAYTSSQTSNWTQSAHFQPLTDTVFGPPGLTVSGCGNCLLLHLTVPASGGLKQQLQLRDLYRSLEFQVKRTRDGAQTGVEYCVSVRVSGLLTSTSSLFSQPHCAFTSPPSPLDKSVLLVLGLTGALCALCLFLSGLVIYRGGRSFRRCSLLSALVCQ
ncbi:interferon alpha/beta receptor 2-like isoform X6 [Xyrichtys novacula]|uniref:Interferon alpha/beta receptor 2-like isoform X6 n=1 Tax=Xyrichtys novacula TaxID=13765 RepID=A0AAV1GYJ5_XYRNO|nr:interferon alpha/beta receptor 2-like isoform X6 [Xyrichtys novacula]